MLQKLFGRHLYAQIVFPLVLASLLVGFLATLVALYFLGSLTNGWVDEVVASAASNLESRVNSRASIMVELAQLTASDAELQAAIKSKDMAAVTRRLTAGNTLKYDSVMVLDHEGAVVASVGSKQVPIGSHPLAENDRYAFEIGNGRPMFLRLAGQTTLAALYPIPPLGEYYLGIVKDLGDAQFLTELAGGTGDAFAVYDKFMNRAAVTVRGNAGNPQVTALDEAMRKPDPAVLDAVRQAADGEGEAQFKAGDTNYRTLARRVRLSADPMRGSFVYIVSVVNQAVSDQARSTTANLIMMWSIIAVLGLAGLGGWVARRVSDPLLDLTEGAGRIRDGDFSTRIRVEGANELVELADTFNQMQDSLRERSETLTKKVLELATLYEMSRALGSTLEMGVLLDSVLDSALRIFGVDAGYVTLRDRETGRLELQAWRGGSPTSHMDDAALRNSMSEWVIREGRPLIFNPPKDRIGSSVDEITGAQAALCVPLISAEGTLGAITVGSHDSSFRFTSDDVRLLATIANHVTIAIGNIELFSSLQDAYLATVRSLAAAVDAKDPFTRGHSDRVARYAIMIAVKMGLSHDQRTALEMAAYLHDIGKIGVKEEILLKPGKLTADEMGQMKHHPLIGANILKPVGFPWPITPVVRHHHERWDGEGYPAGLKGEEIPLLARILTVADAFEAMVSDRPYREGRTIEDAISELERCSGTQFDTRITAAFIEALRDEQASGVEVLDAGYEELQPDEIHAIFVALAEGMFASFRKLGGPRLALNVERDLNEYFEVNELPFRIAQGRISAPLDLESNGHEVDQMREALNTMDEMMGRMSGATLVDHFYADAAAGLSERMRDLAVALGFLRG